MYNQNISYFATGYGNACVPTLYCSDVTATATSKSKSFISQEDAQNNANEIAYNSALEMAIIKSNIINQAVSISENLLNNFKNEMNLKKQDIPETPKNDLLNIFSNEEEYNNQQNNTIAIGNSAGYNNQKMGSIAIGNKAGFSNQENNSIALGYSAGQNNQKDHSIAIGYAAGNDNQQNNSIAIGYGAGYSSQKNNSIAIGIAAGFKDQKENSIAIGASAGYSKISENSIILNASGADVSSDNSGFFVSPISPFSLNSSGSTGVMIYNNISKQIQYESTKTFVIDHPINPDKYLVHACLEGPEAGVYYRGEGKIENDKYTTIFLPEYVSTFADNLSVQITQILNNIDDNMIILGATKIENNKFEVCGKNSSFWWTVYGKRIDINVEPNKKDVELKGNGPYIWI